MVWSWSHTAEGEANVERSIRAMPHEELVTIVAEIRTAKKLMEEEGKTEVDYVGDPPFEVSVCEAFERELKERGTEELANEVVAYAFEARRCTNGGHYAYACPYLCGPHQASFDGPTRNEG